MTGIKRYFREISPMKVILACFLLIIMIGTVLLLLPVSQKSGAEPTHFLDALFTATSATCVTGLIRFDTYTHWSLFGQLVILSMIQIGGIGFMTFAIYAISKTKRKIGLKTRMIMQNSISAPQMGGMVRTTRLIFLGTFIIEGTAAVLLCFYYCPRFGFAEGLWFSVFHSISAFCNAGFDLMGKTGEFSSLTGLSGNVYVCMIIMVLIVVGGLGILVWKDLLEHRFHLKKCRLHTRLVIVTTAALIIGGTILIFVLELPNAQFREVSGKEQILGSLFQSVTTRTAGFNTWNLSGMTQASQFVLITLMMIGGSSGSTAGGMKTTTFAVCVMSIVSELKRKKEVEAFGRHLETETVRAALVILTIYLLLSISGAMILSTAEGVTMMEALFETVSAIGTVGLTLGITTGLSAVSQIVLIFLMFIGRVGSITLLMAFASDKGHVVSRVPAEKISVG